METIENIKDLVLEAGKIAAKEQLKISLSGKRFYKSDGTVVTQADKMVEEFLVKHIRQLYPQANFVGEESARDFNHNREFTFVIDPIDGTNSYSLGMHGWCVSVGLLDKDLVPIAGIIFAPSLESFIFADIGKPAIFNNKDLPLKEDQRYIMDENSYLMVFSRIHRKLKIYMYPWKLKCIGSTALHLCYPLIYPGVIGAICDISTSAWDIAAAHAISLSLGYDLRYLSDEKLTYAEIIKGGDLKDLGFVGEDAVFNEINQCRLESCAV